jgi:hypothetical protein
VDRCHAEGYAAFFIPSTADPQLLTITPKHGSWLNLVEVFFSKLARTLLRCIRADTPAELEARIVRHLEELNAEPVVFRWKYRLDEIDAASL